MSIDVAQLYSDVFAPEYFLLLATLLVLGYERRDGSRSRPKRLAAQLGVLALAWGLAYAVYDSATLVFETVPAWGDDIMGSLGLAVGFLVLAGAWTVRDWGRRIPAFALFLIAVTIAHAAIVPFWNVSSHVTYTAAPAGYLGTLHRRLLPLLIVPLGMVFSRVFVDAHTWAQSIGGLVLAGAFLAGVVWKRQADTSDRSPRGRA